MRNFENPLGIAINSKAGGQRVTKKSSPEDWMRRLLIALACFWLLVGVVLPLLDVVDRATNIELVVKIEEPTEEEKKEEDFRGQIDIAGHAVLLMLEDGKKEVLYIDNKPAEIRRRKAEVSGVYVELGDERIERVVCDLARPDPMSKEVLSVKPIEIVRTTEQRWLVNDELLPPEENLLLVERFIGLANFFDYFGLKGISQGRTFVALGNILLSITLIGFFFWTLIRPTVPFNQNGMLTLAILLVLAFQAFRSIEFLTQYMEASGLAQSVWNSLRVGFYTTVISVSLAFLYAYGIHRTRIFGKAFFRIVAMIPLFAPTMLYGLSLVYMFGNKGVITTGFFDRFPWLAWDIQLYGLTGIVIAEVVFTFPPAFMILLVALSNTDARLYEA